ncbi:L,D-transpeptidase family protein [Flavobacterium restrictum]|uniref:L,D-transpeptidase family protein n=1 Tax=Flavobacterium restrictum TaxID=2594428 RepID=A0A553DV74_9FLAO|nr:L,D-transpeptidase family protein [Flavobacterium restrictum]TRX36637.1 L,D-transpeptidase family protein [Flavobacterium restrictum]
MKNYILLLLILLGLPLATSSCNSKDKTAPVEAKIAVVAPQATPKITIDSLALQQFYAQYPKLAVYQKEATKLYQKQHFDAIWMDEKGIIEFGNTLYSKSKDLDKEGVLVSFPYEQELDAIFLETQDNNLSTTDTELMITNLYLFYAAKVYKGIDEATTKGIGWLLPRKAISYASVLDSIMTQPKAVEKNEKVVLKQYYKLRAVLAKYRAIEQQGGWKTIELAPYFRTYKRGDSAQAIAQIRSRLFATNDLPTDSKSTVYDAVLEQAVQKYQVRNGNKPEAVITPKLIKNLNIPVAARIKQIMVNMERCRWISPSVLDAPAYIMINIPSYQLYFVKNNQTVLRSNVVVGTAMTKTVIFSGKMSYIVFSPYWNVPTSIINKEVKPGMAKNKNYLDSHHMEWNNGQVRQKPGKNNSLGLVKFMFPNSHSIYLHDTPSKSLFDRENRAFSHGCIRVEKPKELAFEILKNDKKWPQAKILAAMNAGKETTASLQNKIPVYIGYFTTWVDENDGIHFYDDVYNRDERLAKLLFLPN